jgi:hypothetical protein
MDLTRRELLIAAGAAGALAACGGDEVCDEIVTDIDGNHGHTLTVTVADLMAGENRDFVLGPASDDGHTHTVSIAGNALRALGDGGKTVAYSSILPATPEHVKHSHVVRIQVNCH